MYIKVKSAIADLAIAGGSTGILEVDTTNFYVGAEAWLSNTAADGVHVRITKIIDSTHLKVKLLPSGYMAEDYSKGFDATGYDFATATLVGADQADGVYDAILIAVDTGRDGNLITIELVGDSPLAGGVTIDRIDTDFVIHYESGVSTVGDVNTAIGALAGADDLFDVDAAGTIANVLTAPDDDFGPVALSGGSTPSLAMPAQIVRINPKFVKKTSA